ncbi:MAG: sodium-dependent transporter [Armatimonadota bacterium]
MVYRTAERWSSRVSVILAVAGSAVGLGSFLRFPSLVMMYDGGAFLIPYFCALLFLGLPMMWIEWAIGRYGGIWGRHSMPGIFDQVTRRPWGKYLGILGLYLPFVIVVYYLYIESWSLGYTFYSALGNFKDIRPQESSELLQQYLGTSPGSASLPLLAIVFLAVTLAINFYVVYRGVESGIEKVNMIAMPLLFVVTAFLILIVVSSGKVGSQAEIGKALDQLWRPELLWQRPGHPWWDPNIWLAAAGQVFFTLSLAVGAVITYTSYLRKEDDVALGGLTAVSITTFAGVVLGLSIIIPAAVLLLGSGVPSAALAKVPTNDLYALPFASLPLLFAKLPYGSQVGALWFLLLFFAGITSSVSLLQPILAFFQDELGWSRRKGTLVLLALTAAYLVPVVLLQQHGFLKEMDFWAVSFLLPVGALVEVVVFLAILGIGRGWEGITFGALIRVPRVFRFIIQYVMPIYLVVMLGGWLVKETVPNLLLPYVADQDRPTVIIARVLMGVVLLAMLLMVRVAWKRRQEKTETPAEEETTGVT